MKNLYWFVLGFRFLFEFFFIQISPLGYTKSEKKTKQKPNYQMLRLKNRFKNF